MQKGKSLCYCDRTTTKKQPVFNFLGTWFRDTWPPDESQVQLSGPIDNAANGDDSRKKLNPGTY
jgi:hypothetical protein